MSDKTNELIAEISAIDNRAKRLDAELADWRKAQSRCADAIAMVGAERIGLGNRRRQLFADLRSELGVWPEEKPQPVETYTDPDEDPIAGKPTIETYTDPAVFDPAAVQSEYERRAKSLSTYKVEEFNIDNPMTEGESPPGRADDPYMRKNPKTAHIDPI